MLFAALLLLFAGDAPAPAEIPISGRVVDARGAPLPRVPVELIPLPPAIEAQRLQLAGKTVEPTKRAMTDADGRFELAAPDVGMYEVVVRAQDAVPASASLLPLLGAVGLPALRIEKAETLRVRTVAGARVIASPSASTRNAWQPAERGGVADANGIVSIPRLRGETLDIAAVLPDGAEVRASRVSAASVDLRVGATCPARIVVREEAGQPFAGAIVSSSSLILGTTGANGVFAFAASCARATRLRVLAADGRSAIVNVPARAAEAAIATLQKPERANGRVLDGETRAAIANALVWTDDDPAGFVRTDARGVFAIARSPSAVHAAAIGHLAASQKESATFALQPTAALAGSVVDTDGRAVAGAEIRVEETNAETFPRYGVRSEGLQTRTMSRSNGAFRIEVLPRRAYTLHATRAGFAPVKLDVAEKVAPAATRFGLRVVLSSGVTATGKVLDGATSQPVVGSELRLAPVRTSSLPDFVRSMDVEEAEEYRAHSDGQGAFHFEHLPPGRFDLDAKADGFAPHERHGLTIEQSIDLGALRLEKGITVEGSVVDRDGRPIAGAAVAARKPNASGIRAEDLASGDEMLAEAVSDRSGRFALHGLATGDTIDIVARHAGYVPATAGRVELPPTANLTLTLERAARVAGRVVSDRGENVPGAVVTARPIDAALPAGLSGRVATADNNGAFVIEDLGGGRTSFSAIAKGFTAGEPLQLDLAPGRSQDDVVLTLGSGAAIEGTVLTPTGRPATSARVTLRQAMTPDRMIAIEVAGSARTDGDGHYRLEGVPPGPQSISADQSGFQRAVRDLEVRPGENRLDLRLGEGFELSGRVVDAGGRGLAGAAVGVHSSTPGVVRDDTSGPDGTFAFSGLDAGRYSVSATKTGYSAARREVEIAGGAGNVELRLDHGGGAIAGRILGIAAAELSRVDVSAMKRPLDTTDSIKQGRADAAGTYRIDGVFAGDWSVTARLADGRQARQTIAVAEGAGETQLDLEFGRGATLSGTVRRRGQTVPDATVQANGVNSDSSGSAVTDANGAFQIAGLTAGDHRVTATVAQSGARAERVVSVAGNQRIDLDLPSASAAGRVVDAGGGMPLAGVAIVGELTSGSDFAFPRTTSAPDGSFTLPNLGVGSYRIRGEKEGYVRGEVRVDIANEQSAPSDLRLALEREQGLTLDVSSPYGPPSRIGVALLDASSQVVFSQTLSPGENGRTRVSSAPSGSYRLLVGADAMATVSTSVQIPGPPLTINLGRAARLTVDVPELMGKAAVAALLVAGGDGLPFRSLSHGPVQQEWALVNGRTIVDGLPRGSWTLLVTGPDARRWQGTVTVNEGQEAQTSLR